MSWLLAVAALGYPLELYTILRQNITALSHCFELQSDWPLNCYEMLNNWAAIKRISHSSKGIAQQNIAPVLNVLTTGIHFYGIPRPKYRITFCLITIKGLSKRYCCAYMPVLLWLYLLKTDRESCLQASDLWSPNSGWRINLLCTSQEHRQRKRFSCCPLIHSDLSLFPSDVLHILLSTHFSQCKASLRFFPPSQSQSS